MIYNVQNKHSNIIEIPVMIHIDKPLRSILIKETGDRKLKILKEFSRKLLIQVEKLFQHSSLNHNIKFRLLDTKLLKNNTNFVKIDGNVSKYLSSYCQWQSERKSQRKLLYFSVLLTGLNVYYEKGGNKIWGCTGNFILH